MKKYQVIIEPEAQKDLENIYDFIKTNDMRVKAVRFLKKLKDAIDSLEFMPERFIYPIKM